MQTLVHTFYLSQIEDGETLKDLDRQALSQAYAAHGETPLQKNTSR
jgi:hypothetical protein